MQDFRNEKKQFKVATLDFISARFVMGYPCVRHFVLYCFELCKYHKITQIQNGRLAAILKLLPKVNGAII